ncbi:GntR family transcriptional regulator [Lampropedia puyangensis]|uniref:GntR family transcriptional regulator n=1 Tax=Lampropedia puyangensis TaxID=1330072 RepID=A0A4S8EXQ4_9BURK|nr:GntR family transcriptional regulator [Lampropedia puyangensis]THT97471.1 GntR family transcriptional regulator [Lampropedia puyangensis]
MLPTGIQDIHLAQEQPEPFYVQLQRQLQSLIASGVLSEGSHLPSERDLADALNVSRTTVKRAYDALREADVIASGNGRGGTVVKGMPRVSPVMSRLKGFTEEMQELGMEPSTRLLGLEVVHERTIASIFGRPSNAPLLHVRRLRMGDGVPMSRELAWYDLSLAPQLEDWSGEGSIYAWLREHCGIQMAGAEQSIEAIMSSKQEMQAFGFDTPMPCLLIKRKSLDVDGRMVEYVEGTFRGDAYAYRVHLAG